MDILVLFSIFLQTPHISNHLNPKNIKIAYNPQKFFKMPKTLKINLISPIKNQNGKKKQAEIGTAKKTNKK
jgi:hypothetical protein